MQKKKYNIALIPKVKSKVVIELAQNFSAIADQYLLGEQSLPHVTLYQFHASNHEIELILKKLSASPLPKEIDLIFMHFSCITFDGNTFSTSLIPSSVDILNKMHKQVAEIIHQPAKQNYDPHMTLMDTKNKNYESLVDDVKKSYEPITDTFILSLGESDEIGQYLKKLCMIDKR